jgi:hypothetical protein
LKLGIILQRQCKDNTKTATNTKTKTKARQRRRQRRDSGKDNDKDKDNSISAPNWTVMICTTNSIPGSTYEFKVHCASTSGATIAGASTSGASTSAAITSGASTSGASPTQSRSRQLLFFLPCTRRQRLSVTGLTTNHRARRTGQSRHRHKQREITNNVTHTNKPQIGAQTNHTSAHNHRDAQPETNNVDKQRGQTTFMFCYSNPFRPSRLTFSDAVDKPPQVTFLPIC